jgi:hypothetical protein
MKKVYQGNITTMPSYEQNQKEENDTTPNKDKLNDKKA